MLDIENLLFHICFNQEIFLAELPSISRRGTRYCSKITFLPFKGEMMPSLLFPVSTLEEIEFRMRIMIPGLSASFFLRMREALTLSTKCRVHIDISFKNHDLQPFEIAIDELRTRRPFPPAMNVELSFITNGD
ncbi:unnamed protein product [Lactuca saligna]|uniref:Uncharacterized protein n=1 Tax=Lactuca saligna TaxID=75948 RepID=A0AA35Z392_LACSI|nr:unnamed protein product [Lactuca saligna]